MLCVRLRQGSATGDAPNSDSEEKKRWKGGKYLGIIDGPAGFPSKALTMVWICGLWKP